MTIKTIKFRSYLVNLVLSKEKDATWRLFDDKNLSIGDKLELMNWETKEVFAKAIIIEVKEKPLGTLTEKDWQGHEKFDSEELMYKTYQKYYPDKIVNKNTIVKIINFKLD